MAISGSGRDFIDDTSFAHNDDAIGQLQQLVQVFADQQHGAPCVAHLDNAAMNFGHCGKVQAEHGVGSDQHLDVTSQFTR